MVNKNLDESLKYRCYECGRESGEEDFVDINGVHICRSDVNSSCLPEYLETLPERR